MSELSCNFANNISRYSIAHSAQPMALRKTPKAHWELAVAQTKRAGVHGEQPAALRKLPIAH